MNEERRDSTTISGVVDDSPDKGNGCHFEASSTIRANVVEPHSDKGNTIYIDNDKDVMVPMNKFTYRWKLS